MIKWPEPVGAAYTIASVQHCTITEVLPDTNFYTEAQLKQAVRDAVEACARVADCRDLPATSAAIRALIKEIPE